MRKHLEITYDGKQLYFGDVDEITWTESDRGISVEAVKARELVTSRLEESPF